MYWVFCVLWFLTGLLAFAPLTFLIWEKLKYRKAVNKKNKVLKLFNEIKAIPTLPENLLTGNFQLFIIKKEIFDWSGFNPKYMPFPLINNPDKLTIESHMDVKVKLGAVSAALSARYCCRIDPVFYEFRGSDNMWLGEKKSTDYGKTWKLRYSI